jgi:hypothetical protein
VLSDFLKMARNEESEVWYMLLRADRSLMRKYMADPRWATGRYTCCVCEKEQEPSG